MIFSLQGMPTKKKQRGRETSPPNPRKMKATKIQNFLVLASKMIDAGMDEITITEVLIHQLNTEVENLKIEAFNRIPVIPVEYINE
jgi:hypothetical protein